MKTTRGILLLIFVTIVTIGTAMARIEASPVKIDQYGMSPAEWLAIIVGLGAVIQHIGRYYQKKRSNPVLTYDPGYLYTTVLGIIALCQVTLSIPVAELTGAAILYAFATGLGITEGINKITRVKR